MVPTWMAVNVSAAAPRKRCRSRSHAGRGRRPSALVLRARPQRTLADSRAQVTRPLARATYHHSWLVMAPLSGPHLSGAWETAPCLSAQRQAHGEDGAAVVGVGRGGRAAMLGRDAR